MNELYFILFVVLFASVFLWFFLVWRLFNILKEDHPEKFESMGSPTLFCNNSPRTSVKLMKFIFKRQYLELESSRVLKLGNVMFAFAIIYIGLFLLLFIGVASNGAP